MRHGLRVCMFLGLTGSSDEEKKPDKNSVRVLSNTKYYAFTKKTLDLFYVHTKAVA